MEKVLRTWILDHMTANSLISPHQYGFLPHRSTTTQLRQAVEQWHDILDEGGELDVVYFDFAKAFDTVPHKRLLEKLSGYGISPRIIAWIQSYLSNRSQRVKVKGTTSEWHTVTSGIPQGSVLGPINFVLYINDLPASVLFADDTKLFKRITSQLDRLSLPEDIGSMDEWSETWLIKYQPPKCNTMSINSRGEDRPEASYSLGNTELNRVTSEKDLGVSIDNRLTFDEHITNVTNKANSIMGVIRRSFSHMDVPVFRQLFRSLVRPHLEYAQPVWSPYKRGQILQLEQVQRRATRLVPALKGLSYPDRLR